MAWDWEKLNRQHQQQSGGVPPQMDDLVNQLKKFKPPGGSVLIIAVVVLLMIGYSVFFTIESGSVGVVQRFGKFVRIANPGPNFKLPFGIEKVTKVRQDRVYKEEFGFQSERGEYAGRYAAASDTASIALMLTGALAREIFRTVRTVIVDEIHTLAGNKRGVHLALSLERLAQVAAVDQRGHGVGQLVGPVAQVDEVTFFVGFQGFTIYLDRHVYLL